MCECGAGCGGGGGGMIGVGEGGYHALLMAVGGDCSQGAQDSTVIDRWWGC